MLPLPQSKNRRIGLGIAHEVITPHAFHRDNTPLPDHFQSSHDRVIGDDLAGLPASEMKRWTTGGTANILRVIATVIGVLVFLETPIARRKNPHGRLLPIQRKATNQRIAGAALRALREGVTVATVLWIRNLIETIGTDRLIRGQDAKSPCRVVTLKDPKSHQALYPRL